MGVGEVAAKRTYVIKKLLIALVISVLILASLDKFLISWYPVWQAAHIFQEGMKSDF